MLVQNKFDELKEINWRTIDWQSELKNNVNSVDKLKEYIDLTDVEEQMLIKVADNHPMNIPRYYLSLINDNIENDPISHESDLFY